MDTGDMTKNAVSERHAPHAVALFSGGLDSILAARLLIEQQLSVLCLHFVTPFFGKPERIPHWEKIYGLEIRAVDIGIDFVRLLQRFPEHGYGKVMNPCVDCKILMMRKAREIMRELGAALVVSGEVLGQRPMSQRKDTLNIILRESGMTGQLLRPLCARHLQPTQAELSGLVDRSRLGSIFGRGRRDQLKLAERMGLEEIPTPAGGCKLAEKENARRYWPVLTRLANPRPADFELANVGRQFWRDDAWLTIGRNEADNVLLAAMLGWRTEADGTVVPGPFRSDSFGPDTVFLRLAMLPGPLALLRFPDRSGHVGQDVNGIMPLLAEAAALVASYAPRAADHEVAVQCLTAGTEAPRIIHVRPRRESSFAAGGPSFEEIRDGLHPGTPFEKG